MRRLAGMLLATLLSAPVTAAPADPEAFATDMMQRLQPRFPGSTLVPLAGEPLSLVLTAADGKEEGTINLHRIFGFCATASVEDCTRIKAEFAERLAMKPTTATVDSLRLIVRDAEYFAGIRQTMGNVAGNTPIHRQIGDDLYALLASDSPTTTAILIENGLAELGLTAEQAWTTAWKQTRAKLPKLPQKRQLQSGAVVFEGVEYGASLLIDTEGWAKLAGAMGPDLFVTVVADGLVFAGMMPAGPGLDKFGDTVRDDCAHQERCVSPHIYRFREGRWVIAQ